MVYFTMAMALFADADYEEILARLTDTPAGWPDCWDPGWRTPGSGGVIQARQRLGSEPLRELFERVAQSVAQEETPRAFLGPWRLVTVDGREWDVPDSPANAEAFGYAGSGDKRSAFPKVRLVALAEWGSQAYFAAAIGGAGAGKGSGEQVLARWLWLLLDEDMLLVADRGYYSFAGGRASAGLRRLPRDRPRAGFGPVYGMEATETPKRMLRAPITCLTTAPTISPPAAPTAIQPALSSFRSRSSWSSMRLSTGDQRA